MLCKEAKPNPSLNLNNLPEEGRIDVLIRSISICFFLGGKNDAFRSDTKFIAYFQKYGRKLIIDGSKIKGIRIDERSVAGFLKKVFQGKHITGIRFEAANWKEIPTIFKEWFILDSKGKRDIQFQENNNVFILGDHIGFTKDELELLEADKKGISLGNTIYLASQTICILNYLLDIKANSHNRVFNEKNS